MSVHLENVRLSYLNCWEPKPNKAGKPKFSASVMIPEDNVKALKVAKRAVEEAIDAAVKSGDLLKEQVEDVISPIRSGTAEYKKKKKSADFNGFYFVNAYSDNQPGVVDRRVRPILDREEMYSGVWAVVDVNFYFTDLGGTPRVAVGLNHILKLKDDDRLDGRTNVQDAFAKYVDNLPDDDEELV